MSDKKDQEKFEDGSLFVETGLIYWLGKFNFNACQAIYLLLGEFRIAGYSDEFNELREKTLSKFKEQEYEDIDNFVYCHTRYNFLRSVLKSRDKGEVIPKWITELDDFKDLEGNLREVADFIFTEWRLLLSDKQQEVAYYLVKGFIEYEDQDEYHKFYYKQLETLTKQDREAVENYVYTYLLHAKATAIDLH